MQAIRSILIPVVLGCLAFPGCATKFRTTLLGAGIGAAVGTAAVAVHDATMSGAKPDYTRNLAIGAAAGAVLGGGLFYLHHHLTEKNEDEIVRSTTDAFLLHKDDLKGAAPRKDEGNPWTYLKDPSRIEWVEPYFDENQALHERHRRFFIYKRSAPTREQPNVKQ